MVESLTDAGARHGKECNLTRQISGQLDIPSWSKDENHEQLN